MIVNTALRPDVVLYSEKFRRVIMIQLTCGNEENFEDQRVGKLRRYEQQLVEIETAGWKGLKEISLRKKLDVEGYTTRRSQEFSTV